MVDTFIFVYKFSNKKNKFIKKGYSWDAIRTNSFYRIERQNDN